MEATTIGLDIAKQVFVLHGVDGHSKTVLRKKLTRLQVLPYFANLAAAHIGIEACAGSHYWARKLIGLGHQVQLIAAQHVKPYVSGNKTDANDAAAICEAASRPRVREVAINSEAQQDVQMLHRIRRRLVDERTALICQIRGLLGEYGIVFAVGPAQARRGLNRLLACDDHGLSGLAVELLSDLQAQLGERDERIAAYDARVKRVAKDDPLASKLLALPGVGPVTATALVAAVNDGKLYASGRQMAANLGITPHEHSSGGKQRLSGITKRGNAYVRMLLIHGARSVLKQVDKHTDPLSLWAAQVKARRGMNVASVALANKLARIAWAVLAHNRVYCSDWRARVHTEPQPTHA